VSKLSFLERLSFGIAFQDYTLFCGKIGGGIDFRFFLPYFALLESGALCYSNGDLFIPLVRDAIINES